MSRLSGRLRSAGVRLACGALAEEECGEAEGSSPWEGDVGLEGSTAGLTDSAPQAALRYHLYSASALSNGVQNHDDQLQSRARRRRHMDHGEQTNTPEQMHRTQNTQTHTHQQSDMLTQTNACLQTSHTHGPADPHLQIERNTLTHAHSHAQMNLDIHMDSSSSIMEENISLLPQDLSKRPQNETHTPHIQPVLPPTSEIKRSPTTAAHNQETHKSITPPHLEPDHTTIPDTCHPPNTGHTPISTPIEAERKYTLRSSGRPRFPCRLRKSSRLRRAAEETEVKRGEELKDEEEEARRWKGEEVRMREEHPAEVGMPTASCEVKPEPACLSSVASSPGVTDQLGRIECLMAPLLTKRKRRGRFLGVRKIVVKVARIPVHLSRRQKSYKISSLEPAGAVPRGDVGPGVEGPEGGVGVEGGPVAPREPTALLRMKNNGKSVMVMFPPGELPVILKRRRGRPPKQALPGQPDLRETRAGAANAAEPKKPRRRRRVKLPSPQPSYVNDTNDVKVEYGDVLSKLAFLNRQPPSTGRCSPPRCWTPTDPETFHKPPENPTLTTLLHRLTGFRRRGGRAGCMGGRGGGAAGCSESAKSTFSDFFETIGKKRKVPPSEPGLPRKRGKGGSGGISRAALAEQGVPVPGEKAVRKRRSRKNGTLKTGQGASEQDWANGSSGWGGKSGADTPERAGGYQGSASPRGNFPTCEAGKGGLYHSPGARGGGNGEEAQGMFAGYFRSLLDSDDSSDLLDISMSSPAGRPDTRKLTPGYESSSPAAAAHRWSPAVPKWSPKGGACAGEGTLQPSPQSQNSSTSRPPYTYSVSQTSPTTCFPKSPVLSLSRSPSSPHPSSSGFTQYPTGYSAGTASGGSNFPIPQHHQQQQQQQQQQRMSDCSFAYGAKTSTAPLATQCQMSYSNYHASGKRGYSGYPGQAQSVMLRGESSGPASPGGTYMSVTKSSPFSSTSCSPDGCRQYPSSAQWGYRQGSHSWGGDGFGTHQFHGYTDYGVTGAASESKDILDISNYTPQKAKQRSCPDTLSESSSDSSHTGGGGLGGIAGSFTPRDVSVVPEGQSSLSSLEKLMLDWHENSAGPSYNWSQNVLFQGGAKAGRGRRKRAEPQGEREACPGAVPPGSPTSPPGQGGGPKRSSTGGKQPRGARGRGGYSPCQRERPPVPKPKPQKPSTPTGAGQISGAGGVFQEALDYYSGDSSSLSPLSHAPEPCEYPSPYSVHTSTPSSDERFAQIYPSDSASLSPSLPAQPDVLKPYPKPAPPVQTYGHTSRTFSPTLSPTPRLLPQCGSTLSPHRVPKDHFPQYDSPSYSSSPCWFGQGGSVAGSPHSYEEQRPPASILPPHKRDLSLMSTGMRVPSHSPYPSPIHRGPTLTSSCGGGTIDSSPQSEELGYHGNMDSYAHLGNRYVPPTSRGGVLCQLLDQPSDDGFTVTSL
ncbi:AT-hook DNA-binding motif-containing protein 1 [Chanos chanos]|uniref:AT-hook DNA-binding motif-containing protein 1 n=1 Tax=Chanos chanos TaxID=29144 RepID=A0A6J2WP50_CHACN|nr:AT-hook DNA-binding motif-containing protein 1 [Chanos chanos]